MAQAVECAQRVRVTRLGGEDLYLTTERHDRQRQGTADVTTRLLGALTGSDEGFRAVLVAVPQVFPWAQHLSADEVCEFVADLVDALRDTAGLDVHADLYRVIVEWRATARILADPDLDARPTMTLSGEDHGDVPVP
ncbi:hypothetical protein NE235_04390 [Actinoallomurus spadix]|uniref:hypothetical protein n=1 Tax=Actinoallomurus spadix TaxID=79912 RepID=UPI0020936A44|nr:hypothetical protein [Actinoallomurus spadix]MCO5985342.1 hypothetical protein [Actinoallomurus spadix]